MIAAIAARIAFVLLGYVAGIIAGSAAFPCMLALISLAVPDSNLWNWLGLGPVAMIAAPAVFLFILWMTVVLTFVQAIIANALSELFTLRASWIHLAMAVALALSAVMLLDRDWFADMDINKWLITFAAFCGALVGGVVYWAIAGRNAGAWRDEGQKGNIASQTGGGHKKAARGHPRIKDRVEQPKTPELLLRASQVGRD